MRALKLANVVKQGYYRIGAKFLHTDDMESQEANIKTLGGISLRDGYCFQATPSPTCRLRDFAWRG